MFSNSNLRLRILFGYSFPILCLMALGAIIYSSVTSAFERLTAIRTAQTVINDVNEIAFGLGTMVRNARGYVLFPKDSTYLESYKNGLTIFQSSYTDLSQQNITPELQRHLAFFKTEQEQHQKLAEQVFRLVDAGQIAQTKPLLIAMRMVEVEDRRREIINQQTALLKRHTEEGQQAQTLLIQLVLLGTILSTLFTILVGVWVSQAIAKPLGAKITGIVTVAERISTGDLTTPIERSAKDSPEVNQLLAAFQAMTSNLSALISQVQHSGIQATSSTTEIAAAGKQLEATVTEQVAATHQVATTAREIASTAEALSLTMETIADKAQATTTAADAGQQDLVLIASTVQQFAQATHSISTKLAVMNEKANTINTIVVTMTKVADQINLLSLNAAIEAEKAGDYGLGFAVVAREIRRLSDQTAVATLDIEQMVREMQAAVSTGVMEMDKFSQDVEQTVITVGKVSDQLSQVIAQIQSLVPQFEVVNQGMETQAQGSQQITESMQQLNQVSVQTADALQEINSAIAVLNQTIKGLHQEISRFKVNPLAPPPFSAPAYS